MKPLSIVHDFARIQLTREEVRMLNNALNEVCNGLSIPDFSTRMGFEFEEVERVLKQISSLLHDMNGS